MIDELCKIIQPALTLANDLADRRHLLERTEKSAGDFVSEADEAIERTLRSAIKTAFGNVPIIGEEHGGSLNPSDSGWAIDPIDGTTNFLRGLPMWGISVGVLEAGKSVAGVMALPDLNLVLAADSSGRLELNGQPFTRHVPVSGSKLIALGENDFEPAHRTDERAEMFRRRGCQLVRYRSAVFSLASAALGRLDGYSEYGCFVWDVAAAGVICENAGLSITLTKLEAGRYAVEAHASA